jgi:hypothetical protein
MKQLLLNCPSLIEFSARTEQRKSVAQKSEGVFIITPSGFVCPVFFEVDEGGGESFHDDGMDPDDMTDYWFWYHYIKKS